MAEAKVKFTVEDEARARALSDILADKGDGYRPVMRSGDLARLSLSVMLSAEVLVQLVKSRRTELPAPPIQPAALPLPLALGEDPGQLLGDMLASVDNVGGNLDEAKRHGLETPYRAALEAVRLLWRGEHEVAKGSVPLLPAPVGGGGLAQMGVVPVVPLVLGVVGIVAAAVTYYYVADRVCQVQDGSALVAVVLKAQLEELQLRIAKGAPLPEPNKPLEPSALMRQLADANAATPWWLLGAGAAAAALAGVGLYGATKKGARSSSASREIVYANPAPRRRARGVRRNPLKHGFSRDTVSRNIAGMLKAGKPRAVAAAASLHAARVDYRKRHPSGAFPRHLETPGERSQYEYGKAKARPKPKAKPKRRARARPKLKPKARRKGKARKGARR